MAPAFVPDWDRDIPDAAKELVFEMLRKAHAHALEEAAQHAATAEQAAEFALMARGILSAAAAKLGGAIEVGS